MAMPAFGTTTEYLLFVLSVTITTLGLLTIGGIVKMVFGRHKRAATFRKKLLFFPIFVVGIFAIGWLSATAQQLIHARLQQNLASGIGGVLLAVLVAWLLYDWAIWRSGR